ncbi:hypothetical protein V7S43_012631 [Phytophthora oleae]|uniref:Uncharacterized protein n=1 Tax=Phytophthora oleae TaxID=2107226 RepID=A0ABD3F9W5_9STRA
MPTKSLTTRRKRSNVVAEHSVDLIYCGMDPASWNDIAQKVLKQETGIFETIWTVDEPTESPIAPPCIILHQFVNAPCTEYLLELKLIETGQLKTVIDSVHPLENVAEGA